MSKREESINEVLNLNANDFAKEDFENLYKYARKMFIEDKDYSSPMGKIYKAIDSYTLYRVASYLRDKQIGMFKDYNNYSPRQANKLTSLKQLCKFMNKIEDNNIFNETVTIWLDRLKWSLKTSLELEAEVKRQLRS